MAISDENGGTGMVMPVGPMGYGYGGGYGGGGLFGGDITSILILFLFFAMFGNGGWGGNNGANFLPFMMGGQNTANDVQRGFDQSAIMGGINSISTGLCNGFAGVNATVANGFAQAEIAANARQVADLQQQFALQQQLSNCCCENRLATANLNSTILSENCADRAALSDGVRDIITNQNANTQRLLDQLCNDKIDAKNEKIADLERQLTMANLAASQTAQTAAILANNEAQTAALERYLAPNPVPAYTVPNPNCCANNFGCGCGA